MLTFVVCFLFVSIATHQNVLAAPAETGIYQEIQNGHFKFTLDLSKGISKADSSSDYNIFSPADIYAALSIASYPAGGQTKQQLVNALGLTSASNDWNDLHTKLANLFLSAENNVYTNLSIANGLFVDNNFQINESFKQFAQNVYKCELAKVDYANNGQQTIDKINKWVSDKTNGRIPKVCQEPYDSNTKLVLASALYFHAKWQDAFLTYETFKVDFNYEGNKKIEIPLMGKTSTVQYLEDPVKKYKAIGLDYKGNEASIYYILPDEGTTLQSVANELKSEDLIRLISSNKTLVSLKIPKMKLEYESDLVNHLRTLGVADMFTDKADFSGLAPSIQVSKVTHKVEIKINEEGTVGSAVTLISFIEKSGKFYLNDPIPFTVNRPFLFFIHHHATNLIVFYGSVKKPTPLIEESGIVPSGTDIQ